MLFLSVDVIGSTVYKKRPPEKDEIQPWLLFFLDFYREFPNIFIKNCNKNAEVELGVYDFKQPEIWKSLGDELIFTIEMDHSALAFFYIKSFKDSVLEYRNLMENDKKLPLSLKASAWLAGFPVINAEIFSSASPKLIDYIGPLIDIGFRLSKFSSKRKFVISVDLALMILEHLKPSLKLFYDGRVDLKGINLTDGYPFIWIDMYDKKDYKIRNEQEVNPNPSTEKLKNFCRSFISSEEEPFIIPFINNPQEKIFNKKPKGFRKRKIIIEKFYKTWSEKSDKEDGSKSTNKSMLDAVDININQNYK